MNRTETLPATDLDKLLDRERTLAGLPARIDLSQITGLWRLDHSYRYDPERRSWVTPISHLHDDVRTRFDANGTLENTKPNSRRFAALTASILGTGH